MKKLKYIIVTTLIICIPVVVKALSLEVTDDILYTKEFKSLSEQVYREKYGDNYLEIFEKNNRATQNAQKITSMFEKDYNEELIYPDYIGGIYIDEDDNLVIQVVEKNVNNKKSSNTAVLNNIMSIDNNSITEYVEYSYSELKNIQNIITNKFETGKYFDLISMFYIDEALNNVVVVLKNLDDKSIKTFKEEIIDTDLVTFIEGGEMKTSSDINAGGPISIGCSVGYRARKSLIDSGFVTAAHCVELNEIISNFGTVKSRTFGSEIDAAWIDSTAGLPLTAKPIPQNTFHKYSSSTTPSGSLSTSVATSYIKGQKVGRIAAKSYFQTGTITAVNTTFGIYLDDKTVVFKNQVKTDVYQIEGDSGGVVFLISNNQTMGIGTFRDQEYQMTFSRADRINSILGISRY